MVGETMEEENAVNLKKIVKVLLGNKWLYLLMAAIFLIVSVAGLSVYSSINTEYVAFYDYNVAGFSTLVDETGNAKAKYIDGEKFDPRLVVTKEKIKELFSNRDELRLLDVEKLYEKDLIKSYGYKIKYEKNDHKKDEKDVDYLESKRGYELVINSNLLSKSQAKALSEEIANEVVRVSNVKIDKIEYDSFLKYYESTSNYPEKISSLDNGINYLKDLSNNLIETYGDVLLSDAKYGGEDDKYFLSSKTISAWQKQLNIAFDGYYVNSLLSELETNGFISSDSAMYAATLKTNITNLERQIDVDEAVLNDLKTQRDALVSAIGTNATIESVEIGEYNTEIIALTKKIAEEKESVDIYRLQLEKLDTSSFTQEELEEYTSKLLNFNTKLQNIKDDLEFYTNQYEAIAKNIMKNGSRVHFDSPNVVTTQGNLKTTFIVGTSIAVGIFAPMIINVFLAAFTIADGKPISLKRKKENN